MGHSVSITMFIIWVTTTALERWTILMGRTHLANGMITLYVSINTPGENDGTLRAWMNGTQVYERTDFQFCDADHPHAGITRAYGGYIYWGGDWGSPASQNVYFKDMTFAHG